MERYALHQSRSAIASPPGTRVILVRTEEADDGTWTVEHDVLTVVGFQPTVVHHYTTEQARPVHPDPVLMDKHGWHYKHPEVRYAPICITHDGRVSALDPDDPRWYLLPAGFTDDRIALLIRKLKDEETIRQALERRIENQDQGNVEGD